MTSVIRDVKGWQIRFFDSENAMRTPRPGKGIVKVCLMFLVTMAILCPRVSAEEKETILETLTKKESATLDELAPADRRYAIGCLSSHVRNRRSGWANLREGEYFVATSSLGVGQIIDEQNFLSYGNEAWVEGISTRGVADGATADLRGIPFICVGNKTYSTATGGSQTVMHIVHVNPDNVVKTLRPIAEARGLRVWGEGTGDLVLAEFVGANSRELTIKLWTGNRKRISMKAVGAIDIAWIAEQNKE